MRALLVVALVAVAIGGVLLLKRQRADDDAARPTVAVPARLAAVQMQMLARTVEVPGELAAFETATITAQVAGVVRSIAKRPGDRVEAGEVVATLDAERFELAVRSADAAVAQAEAELAEAQASYARSVQAEQRQTGLVSSDELARLRARVDRAVASQAAAGVHLAQAQLDRTQSAIAAPFAGIIETCAIDTGAAVQIGSPIATIVCRDPVQVLFHLAAEDAALVTPGLLVQVAVNAADAHTCRVRQVAAVADPGSRQVRLRAELADAPAAFRPGRFCTVAITLGAERTGVVVPEAAVRVSDQGELVFVAESKDGRTIARRRNIRIGAHLPGLVEALDGVAAGDRVVVQATDAVADGVELTIAPNDD